MCNFDEGIGGCENSSADMVLEIPQFGEKESLNVAVAFGIAMFLLVDKLRTPP